MKIAIAAFLVLATIPVNAQPAPAGKCSLIDGLVARKIPPSASADRREIPHVISMTLPRMAALGVADMTFRIETDGKVTSPKVLCVSDNLTGLADALLKASQNWRFSPMKEFGKTVPAQAVFRISNGGVVPLSFEPRRVLQKIEG